MLERCRVKQLIRGSTKGEPQDLGEALEGMEESLPEKRLMRHTMNRSILQAFCGARGLV